MSDLISRQAAIDAMAKHFGTDAELLKGCDINTFWNPAHVLFVLEDLPSAEPKKGKWIPSEEGSTEAGSCSNCGWTAYLYENDVVGMPYCPNCGADMRKSE